MRSLKWILELDRFGAGRNSTADASQIQYLGLLQSLSQLNSRKELFLMLFICVSVLAFWGQKEKRNSDSWSLQHFLQEASLLTWQHLPAWVLQRMRLLGWTLLLTPMEVRGNLPADASDLLLAVQKNPDPCKGCKVGICSSTDSAKSRE